MRVIQRFTERSLTLVERILTLVASLRLLGCARSTLDPLTEAYLAQLRGTAHPSLLSMLTATR